MKILLFLTDEKHKISIHQLMCLVCILIKRSQELSLLLLFEWKEGRKDKTCLTRSVLVGENSRPHVFASIPPSSSLSPSHLQPVFVWLPNKKMVNIQ